MAWNKERIDGVAVASSHEDYLAFEAIGLTQIEQAHVLDIGCFDGFNTVLKFKPFENITQVTGIDTYTEGLAIARQATDDPRFNWIEASAEEFDGASESFDIVYFSHSFQHLVDKERALANVYRMLKPGGFVIIKTIDDSNKMSYPDSQNVMERLFALYEEHVLPNTPHTAHTERNNGKTCYPRLKAAGFTNIQVRTTLTDTCNKTLEQRRGLFERCVYFRKNVPACVDPKVADEIHNLIDAWGALFEQEDYYYASTTFVVLGQKPGENSQDFSYQGPLFGQSKAPTAKSDEPWSVSPLREQELGQVMGIEMQAFPDPWTPVAYAMELRYNSRGHYLAAHNQQGSIGGYLGWWDGGSVATIAHVASDPAQRRRGIGRMLLEEACRQAANAGCETMQLQVRAANSTARAFYKACGFEDVSTSAGYYTNPDDDAVIMVRSLIPSESENKQ